MDALGLLTADHNRVRGLFARFEAAHEDEDTRAMGEMAQNITRELQVHTQIEEDVFYPAIRRNQTFEEMVAEAVEEHHVVDVLTEELSGLSPGTEDWVAKMQVMMENVEHHASEEEQEMFPEVRKAFEQEALVDLAERLEARKAELGAPTTADKQNLSVEQLRALASEQQIPGRSDMDREELMATVAPD